MQAKISHRDGVPTFCKACKAWPLLVIEGSGRFADELSTAVGDGQRAKYVEVAEIARSDRVALFHVEDAAQKLRDQLHRML